MFLQRGGVEGVCGGARQDKSVAAALDFFGDLTPGTGDSGTLGAAVHHERDDVGVSEGGQDSERKAGSGKKRKRRKSKCNPMYLVLHERIIEPQLPEL